MIARRRHTRQILGKLRRSPVVALLGPRQCGKSTLARGLARSWRGPHHYFDLENSRDVQRLVDPMDALESLRGLVVLDEVQRRPELFPTLRVLADRRPSPARFLVLGSASPELLRQSSETLAGRLLFHELGGFSVDEVTRATIARLWLRGGLPPSYVAATDAASLEWRRAYVRTFLERDLRAHGFQVAPEAIERFWLMVAHVHGNLLNWSELGRSLGVNDTTVRHYADILEGTFILRLLKPWHENLSKRQVKAPKAYLRDSGLLHALLDIGDERQLRGHPRVGASWEGFALDAIVQRLGADERQCFFWATHQGAELDLLVIAGGRRLGFELKLHSSPGVTPSMRVAMADLRLDSLDVVHAGTASFPLLPRIRAVALRDLLRLVKPLA